MSVQVIVQPPATLVLQQDVTSANVTQETTRTLEIVTAGPQGPRGDDGADGAAGANGDGGTRDRLYQGVIIVQPGITVPA